VKVDSEQFTKSYIGYSKEKKSIFSMTEATWLCFLLKINDIIMQHWRSWETKSRRKPYEDQRFV